MNGELADLYQQLILDHHARPRNFGELEQFTHSAEGHNPLCGDALTIELDVHDGIVRDLRFRGTGCAISRASASLMTAAVKGKTVAQVERLFERFHDLCTGSGGEPASGDLGKLKAFAGVRDYPSRVKCATLAWHTLRAALTESHGVVSTE